MNRISLLTLFVLVTGCATQLTIPGKKVRVVEGSPEYIKDCEFIGVVDHTHYSGWNPNDNKLQALNEARNEAGLLGGDTISIVGEYWRGVQVDVYDCKGRNKNT